jgi:hypothetical protein
MTTGNELCVEHGPWTKSATTLVCPACRRLAAKWAIPPEHELAEWWRDQAEKEIEQTITKSAAYGGDNLLMLGEVISDLMEMEKRNELIEAGVVVDELAIAMYCLTKITRILGSYKAGVRPSDDSWMDLHVYAGIRAREVGGWPNKRG